jgi:hypothetical protein
MNIGFLHSGESEFNNLLLERLTGCPGRTHCPIVARG